MTFDRARALAQARVVHYRRPEVPIKDWAPLCGETYAVALTTVRTAVTCRDCIEWLHA